jgi:CDP-paratose 2-epimerase
MFWHFHQNPKPGEVYNAGGGRDNSTSILEAIDTINRIAGKNWNNYIISEQNRIGDQIWYISDLSKFKNDHPDWKITINLKETIKQMVEFELEKLNSLNY